MPVQLKETKTGVTATVILPLKDDQQVQFARFCVNHRLDPLDVAELRHMVNQKADTWTKQNNREIDWDRAETKMDRLDKAIAAKALAMGIYDLDWPGLYPTFTTPAGFKNTMLPEV